MPDQGRQFGCICGGTGDKMVMIGEDCPCLKLPSILSRQYQQAIMEKGEALLGKEMMLFLIGSCRDDIGARLVQAMQRGMRPAGHNQAPRDEGKQACRWKAVASHRTPK